MDSLAENVTALEPIVGHWRSSGRMLDEHGTETLRIEGTDTYEVMDGGHWIIHRVDVHMGDEHTRALEMIGDPGGDGRFVMRAFDASGSFDTMSLRVDGLTFHTEGDGVRNTLAIGADGRSMSVVWERQVNGWVRWMEMDFARIG
jgi:hypothetical protein